MRMSNRVSVCVVATVVVIFVGLANASSQDAPAPQTPAKCPENDATLFHACAMEREKTFEPAHREYEAPRKDEHFEILSLASAPTPGRTPKFDAARPPHNIHKEPPPDIEALA